VTVKDLLALPRALGGLPYTEQGHGQRQRADSSENQFHF